MAHYPADTFQKATEIAIEASNQLHGVINGDANAEVTVEDGSKIPSVRKAMVDSLYFKPPIAWAQGEYEDTYNQLREFVDGDVRTWWFAKGATVSTPVLMSTNPATDVNWTLWSAVTLNAATGGGLTFRNKIIDGRFDFWYEGTSQTSAGFGSSTMWYNQNIGSTKNVTRQALTAGVDLPAIDVPYAQYFHRTVVSSVTGSTNNVLMFQRIENVKTLAGKTATLSFYAKADSNRNVGIELNQQFGSGGSSSVVGIGAQLIPLTTSWQRFTRTINIPSVAGKTIGEGNLLELGFWFDAGSAYASQTTVGQQSGTFDIACVQLEEGSVATPFEELPIEIVKHRINRYFEQLTFPCIRDYNTTFINSSIQWSTTKRRVPTCSISNISNQNNVGSYSIQAIYIDGCRFEVIPSVSTNDTYMFGITLNADARL